MKKLMILVVCIMCMIAMSAMMVHTNGEEVVEPTQTEVVTNPTIYPIVHSEPEPVEEYIDYMALMVLACIDGDYEYGRWACEMRNQKIDSLIEYDGDCQYPKIDFDELMLLSKIMHAEAGGALWISDDWVMCVGEVVLNRVASTEFPDTIYDVIYQRNPVQYGPSIDSNFDNLLPNERCVRLAARLLNGERYMDEPSVVFQAEFRQGSGTFLKFNDSKLGTTYFCMSSYPSLYE